MLKLLLLAIAISTVEPLPQGAPSSVCHTMMPFHGGGILPQGGISPYTIVPRRQGGKVIVTVTSALGIPFQGFLLQGRTPRMYVSKLVIFILNNLALKNLKVNCYCKVIFVQIVETGNCIFFLLSS